MRVAPSRIEFGPDSDHVIMEFITETTSSHGQDMLYAYSYFILDCNKRRGDVYPCRINGQFDTAIFYNVKAGAFWLLIKTPNVTRVMEIHSKKHIADIYNAGIVQGSSDGDIMYISGMEKYTGLKKVAIKAGGEDRVDPLYNIFSWIIQQEYGNYKFLLPNLKRVDFTV